MLRRVRGLMGSRSSNRFEAPAHGEETAVPAADRVSSCTLDERLLAVDQLPLLLLLAAALSTTVTRSPCHAPACTLSCPSLQSWHA